VDENLTELSPGLTNALTYENRNYYQDSAEYKPCCVNPFPLILFILHSRQSPSGIVTLNAYPIKTDYFWSYKGNISNIQDEAWFTNLSQLYA
jgi:hypothetical protein